MKRIATAAVAATLSISAVATPAIAQEKGSSQAYQDCKAIADVYFAAAEDAKNEANTETEKKAVDLEKAAELEEYNSSTPSGTCIKALIDNEDYKAGTLALLIGVPLGLIAILGAAAAYTGAIPGVSLPALPF